MPRRDGFPTNPEMVADFNTIAHQAYIDEFNRIAEHGLPDSFQDKPLDLMYLKARRSVPLVSRIPGAVTDEKLHIRPLTEDHADYLSDLVSRGSREISNDDLDRYHAIARDIGGTTLHNGLDIASVVPVEGAVADYTAYYPNGKTRHISTFKERPSKASIVAGKYFAGETVQAINAPLGGDSKPNGVRHFLTFPKSPNLPLNGHESKVFLNSYANDMYELVMNRGARLERSKAMGDPELVIDSAQELYDEANAAYLRAQALLDKK
jgi:hypothetical protein